MKLPAFKSACLLRTRRSRLLVVGIACSLSVAWLPAAAQDRHQHQHSAPTQKSPPPFVSSTAKPFSALMDDAMAVMDDGMRRAPMSGVAEHDFVTMMIPHHQGAIDMARVVLKHGKDPKVRQLAEQVIAAQEKEILMMREWLAQPG